MDNNTEDPTVEYKSPEITPIVSPSMEDFYGSFSKNELCWWCPIFKIQWWAEYILSSAFISNVSAYLAIRKCQKNNMKKQKEIIKALVRSYRSNFQKFNNEDTPTCFEKIQVQDGHGSFSDAFARGYVNCKTNRNIQTKI